MTADICSSGLDAFQEHRTDVAIGQSVHWTVAGIHFFDHTQNAALSGGNPLSVAEFCPQPELCHIANAIRKLAMQLAGMQRSAI